MAGQASTGQRRLCPDALRPQRSGLPDRTRRPRLGRRGERPEARSLQGPCPARRRLRDRERRQDHVVRRQGVAHRRRQPQPVDVGAGARRHLPRGAAGPQRRPRDAAQAHRHGRRTGQAPGGLRRMGARPRRSQPTRLRGSRTSCPALRCVGWGWHTKPASTRPRRSSIGPRSTWRPRAAATVASAIRPCPARPARATSVARRGVRSASRRWGWASMPGAARWRSGPSATWATCSAATRVS